MKEFLITNLGNIIVIAIILIIVVIGVLLGKTTFVKAFVRGLVVRAEQLYGSKTGEIKRQAVFGWLYQQAPLLALFLPAAALDNLIKEALKWMKEQLATPGVNLLTYAEEQVNVVSSYNNKPPD